MTRIGNPAHFKLLGERAFGTSASVTPIGSPAAFNAVQMGRRDRHPRPSQGRIRWRTGKHQLRNGCRARHDSGGCGRRGDGYDDTPIGVADSKGRCSGQRHPLKANPSIMAKTIIQFGIVSLTSATGLFCGVAVAGASPNVVGQKYSDASSSLSSAGYTPIVSVTVGDHLNRPDCVVVHQQDRTAKPPPNSRGSNTKQTLVALNCDAPVASATTPGNSLGSPEGRAAKAAQQKAAQKSAGQ